MKKSLKGLNLVIVIMLAYISTMFVIDTNIVEQKTKKQSYAFNEHVQRNLNCLAMNVYKEASGESFQGKLAVAQVTVNRAKHPKFPNQICDVVYQTTKITEKIVCQFSWYCSSEHKNQYINKKGKAYQESLRAAKMVYLENFKIKSLEKAIYYHADYIDPNWDKVKLTKIGQHVFYKG